MECHGFFGEEGDLRCFLRVGRRGRVTGVRRNVLGEREWCTLSRRNYLGYVV